MPVLVEQATLLAPEPALRRALQRLGGAAALGADAEIGDGDLLALRFPPGRAAYRALPGLAAAGLELGRAGEPGELAAVGQRQGPVAWWPWLELAVVPVQAAGAGEGAVLAARRAGSEDRAVCLPAGWRFEGSASQREPPAPLRLVDRPLRHLRRVDGADLYRDRWTGEVVILARQHAPARVTVEGPGPGRGEVLVEIVTRDDEVELGLMFREALAPDAGMLFVFGRAGAHAFWMKNTLVPLDLLFVAEDGRVVSVAAGTAPLSPRHYHAAGPARAALEVPAGWCAAHGVGAGARLRVAGAAPGAWPAAPGRGAVGPPGARLV